MSSRRLLASAVFGVLLMTVSLGVAPLAVVPASAATKQYTVTATVVKGKNLTLLLVSSTGRTLKSVAITTDSTKPISLKTPSISTIAGATLQLVNSKTMTSGKASASSGDYFGPVVLGWVGTKRTSATKVYAKLKASTKTTIALGLITVVKSTGKKQGYAYSEKSLTTWADATTLANRINAKNGIPVGVGNYGKKTSTPVTASSLRVFAVGDPCSPTNSPTCSSTVIKLAPPNGGGASGGSSGTTIPGGAPGGSSGTTIPGGAPGGSSGTTIPGSGSSGGGLDKDKSIGGDLDDDGIPNAFDVNDDGDTLVDAADANSPAPKVEVENPSTGVACTAVDFKIFTNFKATQPRFAGTINAYGTGGFLATKDNMAAAITKTMSMVFNKISTVCESSVTKTEIKGIGVPYAPPDYVEIPSACANSPTGDYQWTIGDGKLCGAAFSTPYTFAGTDLPSGQDTFSVRLTTANGEYEFAASPGFVFVTHPMLMSYSTDGVNYTAIDYSSANSAQGQDGYALNSDPPISVSQIATLYFKVTRPQRLPIEGEGSELIDLGGFKYTPDIPNGNPSPGKCDALKTEDTDFKDTPVNTGTPPDPLLLTWAIGTNCYGKSPRNAVWTAGAGDFDIQVEPSGPGGNAAQKVRITFIGSSG